MSNPFLLRARDLNGMVPSTALNWLHALLKVHEEQGRPQLLSSAQVRDDLALHPPDTVVVLPPRQLWRSALQGPWHPLWKISTGLRATENPNS